MSRTSVSPYSVKSTPEYFEFRVDISDGEATVLKYYKATRELRAGVKMSGTWFVDKTIASW